MRYVLRRLERVKMKVKDLKEIIKDMTDDDILFVASFDKEEANEHMNNNIEAETSLTKDEWEYVVNKMDQDENLWHDMFEAFKYYIDASYMARKDKVGKS